MRIEFSLFKHRRDAKNGERHWLTIEEICLQYFQKHEIKEPAADIRDEKNGLNFTIVRYIEEMRNEEGKLVVHRHSNNISGAYGLCIDIDNKGDKNIHPYISKSYIQHALLGYKYILHTTHSHMIPVMEDGVLHEARPKYRAILFFDEVVDVYEYQRIAKHFARLFPNCGHVDLASTTLAQAWYLPSCTKNTTHLAEIIHQDGMLVDTEKILDNEEGSVADDDHQNRIVSDTLRPEAHANSATNLSSYTNINDNVKHFDKNNIKKFSDLKGLFKNNQVFNSGHTLLQRVVNVLSEPQMHVSNFCGANYNEWITIGCAIKGAALPYELFDEWSAQDEKKYKGRIDTFTRWEGFKGEVTEGSIFEIARKRGVEHYLGYKLLRHKQIDGSVKSVQVFDYDAELPHGYISYDESLELEAAVTAPDEAAKYFPEHLVDEAPAPLRLWIDYVLNSSLIPNKILAISSGIAALGGLYHHRARIEEPFRTSSNIYSIGLAVSGIGKNHAGSCIKALYRRLGIVEQIEEKLPGSGHGIYTGLRATDSSMLLLFTEFERQVLEPLTMKATSAPTLAVATELTNLYSQTHEWVKGTSLVKEASNLPLIAYPHISMYGACIPDDFYAYYSHKMGTNGFLGRMIPFVNPTIFIEERETCKDSADIPEDLLKFCREIRSLKRDNLENFSTVPTPNYIKFENADLKKYIKEVGDFWRRKGVEVVNTTNNQRISSIYNRIRENSLKIALVAHEGDVITRRVYDWALEVATTCATTIINNAIEDAPTTAHESDLYKLHKIIKRFSTWVSSEEIAKHSKFIDKDRRKALIENMLQTGMITARKVPTKGRPRDEYLVTKYNK